MRWSLLSILSYIAAYCPELSPIKKGSSVLLNWSLISISGDGEVESSLASFDVLEYYTSMEQAYQNFNAGKYK